LLKEIIRSAENVEDLPNKLRIAQKRMSKEQFEFVFDRWASEVMERASEVRERCRRDNKNPNGNIIKNPTRTPESNEAPFSALSPALGRCDQDLENGPC